MKAFEFGIALLISLSAFAEPIDDPWALVPALPNACYKVQDGFGDAVTAGLATLEEAIGSQTALNDEAGGQLSDMAAADPWAMADRMQEYMMNDPDEATKMMQAMSTTGQTMSDMVAGESEWELDRGTELDGLISDYRAAFADLLVPVDAKLSALPTEIVGEGTEVWTSEALTQLPAIALQANAAYDTLCARWWKPGGPFAGWLTEYRDYLMNERVPKADDLSDQTRRQWQIQGIDTSEVRSTASMDAARDYLNRLNQVYTERQARPVNVNVDEVGGTTFDYGKY